MCEFDWEIFMNILSSASVMMASLSAIYIGCKGLNSWKEENKGKREYELAEEVLSLFYKVENIIINSRNQPSTFKDNLIVSNFEPKAFAKHTLNYLNNNEDLFDKIRIKSFVFKTIFDEKKTQPFYDIFHLKNKLITSSKSILKNKSDDLSNDIDVIRRGYVILENNTKDEINEELKRIMESIKEICRPYIKK
jgi:hypothetical protein